MCRCVCFFLVFALELELVLVLVLLLGVCVNDKDVNAEDGVNVSGSNVKETRRLLVVV